MRLVSLAAFSLVVLALGSPASAKRAPALASPKGVKAFLVNFKEPVSHSFARTPAFAWQPVRNAASYEFELATSSSFNEGTVVWSSSTLKTPVASISASLPWMSGKPYAFWAHARAISPTGVASDWSTPFGFNMRWSKLPTKLEGDEYPGLVQWSLVDGASAYDVWFVDVNKIVRTRTNAADEREYYTFHQGFEWTNTVRWRVRAVRKTYGKLPNLIPSVTYGPWSPVQTSTNPTFQTGPMALTAATSDSISEADAPSAHRLTPGFAFTGNQSLEAKSAELYRVYVFSDEDCVNVVFKGALVGGPAYAPRMTGPLALPSLSGDLLNARNKYLKDGTEGDKTFMADSSKIKTTESDKPVVNGDAPTDPDPAGTAPPSESTAPLPGTPVETGAPIDLWDSGWPNGRYYWTVVPAEPVFTPSIETYLSVPAAAGATSVVVNGIQGIPVGAPIVVGTGTSMDAAIIKSITGQTLRLDRPLVHAHAAREPASVVTDGVEYRELEMPQDACQAGRVQEFGKVSEPVVTGSGSPYVTGLSPKGRLVQAAGGKPSFYGAPLVTWKPALGADQYQIQWSPTRTPWRPVDPVTKTRYEKITYATSSLLDRPVTLADGSSARGPLAPGTWYYRVRGIDFALPGTARAMSWSDPIQVRIAKPVFTVAR